MGDDVTNSSRLHVSGGPSKVGQGWAATEEWTFFSQSSYFDKEDWPKSLSDKQSGREEGMKEKLQSACRIRRHLGISCLAIPFCIA